MLVPFTTCRADLKMHKATQMQIAINTGGPAYLIFFSFPA